MGYVSLIDGHIENAEHCVCCGQVIPEGSQYCIVCGYKVKQEPKQTNYDRIRNMSVEELAKLMNKCDWDFPPYCDYNEAKTCDQNCLKCAKQWLESEVDTE